jgi:formylglycine-generating enzyme required for sulfatase activity
MFCPKCGKQLEGTVKICSLCGKKTDEDHARWPWVVGGVVVVGVVLTIVGWKGRVASIVATPPPASSDAPAAATMAHAPGMVLTNSLGMKFVWIPAGTLQMGNSGQNKVEQAAHSVTISQAFYMGTTVVTQAQWRAVMGTSPSDYMGDNLPVESVSWDDAQVFIRALNAKETVGRYRLPTEAEWEYACRAGTTGVRYADHDAMNMNPYHCYGGHTAHPVGQKQPNAWGLYDMNGDVWQWCQDWYGPYPSGSVTDPQGPTSGSGRVFRGGVRIYSAEFDRSEIRYRLNPGYRILSLGFRLVRTFP